MSDEGRRAAEFERRLELLARGESVPHERGGMEDLALRVRQSLTPPTPTAAFAASARGRLLHRLPRVAVKARPQPRPAFGVFRRLAFAVASVLAAFTLGTASVAYAAQEAIPGDSLYGVKRGVEAARWSLTTNPQSQAMLLSDLASERMREVQRLAVDGREGLLASTLVDYEETLDQLRIVMESLPAEVRARVLVLAQMRVEQHHQVLERLLEQVPPQAVPAIERAIERSSHSQEVLEALEHGVSPSDLAPGQSKTKEPGPKHTPEPKKTKSKD